MTIAIKEPSTKKTSEEIKLKNGITIPDDIKLRPQDIEALNELAETQSLSKLKSF